MKGSALEQVPETIRHYIKLVKESDITEAFKSSQNQLRQVKLNTLNEIGDKTYAKDKWTVKQIIRHLSDWERIFCYRTLIAVRNQEIIPQGFDEKLLAAHSAAERIPLDFLINELISVRESTIAMFEGFDRLDLEKLIINYQHSIPVAAMAYYIIGHQKHHFQIIEERYMPLLC